MRNGATLVGSREAQIRQQVADIFLSAAEYIRTYGWQVSGMSRHGLPRCSMGALASAGADQSWDTQMSVLMYDELYKELNGLTLTEFNHKYRSGEKVARLFERTARRLA